MGFAYVKCSISNLPESVVKISKWKIFDMQLVSLDRVTCQQEFMEQDDINNMNIPRY